MYANTVLRDVAGDFILPYISTSKSPQQVMGSIVKYYFGTKVGKKYVVNLSFSSPHQAHLECCRPDQIYHVAIMPCFDKKLEASRGDFMDEDQVRDVDCVLTAGEVLDMLKEKAIDFPSLEEAPTERLYATFHRTAFLPRSTGLMHDMLHRFTNIDDEGQLYGPQGGSGGYAESIFRHAAKTLYGVNVTDVQFKAGR